MQLIFDGHNDLLHRLWHRQRVGCDPLKEFAEGSPVGHIDAPRARAGGLAGGLCAMYVPSPDLSFKAPDADGHYATPMPEPLDRRESLDVALEMASIATRLDRAGHWTLCRSTADIAGAMAAGRFAAVLHMEGCEAIDTDMRALDVFHAAGLRSLGPVWSRHNAFGHGVPFAFPMAPDTGPGLTDAGRDLVRACNRLGILIDLAHITEKGFWDVAELSDQPLVASHSNPHTLVPVARNLTNRQLDAIRERNGLVGLNFAVTMLRPDSREDSDVAIDVLVRHIDYLVERLGIEGVALGSDFDGALIPRAIGDAGGLPVLVEALREAGYGDAELELICVGNWLRILRSAWHEA